MTKKKMFQRMILGALIKRKSRVAVALFAIAIGTAVISALFSVYFDINMKMSKELRSYGANMVLAPSGTEEKYFSQSQFEDALEIMGKDVVGAAPYLYGVVNIDKHRLVMVGTDFAEVKKVSPYWKISGEWVNNKGLNEAIIGVTAAEKLELNVGDSFWMRAETTGRQARFVVKGLVKTGSTEDNQVFVNLESVQNLLQMTDKINVAYLSVMGKANLLNGKAQEISKEFPFLSAKPIKRIAQSEGVILEKIKSLVYLVVIVILLSTLLCVATTMMTMVIERKREIGLMKALGAPNFSIVLQFLGEGLLLGTGGAVIGSLLGYGFAQIIGQSVFASAISLRPLVFLSVLFVSLVVTCLAALWPVRVAVAIDPAVVLKGE